MCVNASFGNTSIIGTANIHFVIFEHFSVVKLIKDVNANMMEKELDTFKTDAIK